MRGARSRTLTATVSLVLAPACADDPTNFDRAELGISASQQGFVEGSVGCETLPFLHGSRVLSHYVVDDRFEVIVDSTPETARVSFVSVGQALASPLVISRRDLELDFSEEVPLEVDTLRYTVRLVSGCGD